MWFFSWKQSQIRPWQFCMGAMIESCRMWGFPKIGVPPAIILILVGFSTENTLHFGVPPWLWKPPCPLVFVSLRYSNLGRVARIFPKVGWSVAAEFFSPPEILIQYWMNSSEVKKNVVNLGIFDLGFSKNWWLFRLPTVKVGFFFHFLQIKFQGFKHAYCFSRICCSSSFTKLIIK